MNSRERVITTLNYQQPDKIPLDLGGHGSSTLHVSCVKQLQGALWAPERTRYRGWR